MPPAVAKKIQSLKALQTKLKSLQVSFNNISQFVEQFKEGTTANQIAVRLESLDELWEKIGDASCEIEVHEEFEADGDAFIKERAEFETRFYDMKSFMREKMQQLQGPPPSDQSNRSADTSIQSLGDHDLPEVEKFHYLKGCLLGEAKALIDPLPITRVNYLVAWEMLVKRYNNSKLLKKRQIQGLFKLPILVKESVADLHSLLEGFERVIHTLDQIVQPADYRDLLLVDILSARLDPCTRRAWEELSSTKEQDSLLDLTEFLQRRIRILESLPTRNPDTRSQPLLAIQKKPFPVRVSHNAVQSTSAKCYACSENHLLYLCPVFQRMSASTREIFLRTKALCRNCFKYGHLAKDCRANYSCRKCQSKHNTMLCFRKEGAPRIHTQLDERETTASSSNEIPIESGPRVANMASMEEVTCNMSNRRTSTVLLATAVVIVEDQNGSRYPACALLDSGSESNFISERLCQRMNVCRERIDVSVLGIGRSATKVKHSIQATVKSRVSTFARKMKFLVLQRVTVNLPTTTMQTAGWQIPEGIELADPAFFHSKGVDLVLGIPAFFSFFQTGNEMPLGDGLPLLTESVFGWIVSGEISTAGQSSRITCNMAISNNLEKMLERFWSCEEVGETVSTYSTEEARCEEQFWAHSSSRIGR